MYLDWSVTHQPGLYRTPAIDRLLQMACGGGGVTGHRTTQR